MRAVVLTEYGGPEVLRVSEVDDPVPGPDEILVAVEHSAVNRADVLQRLGRYADPRQQVLEIPGLEYAGTVAACGRRVTEWSVGDAVMGIESGGCYAELLATHARQAMAVPAGLERRDAAAVPEVFLTAWDALVLQGGLTSGRWALVHAGASGVGTAAIQIVKAIGANVAVTCSAGKASRCKELGADVVLERSPADWLGSLREALAARGADGVDVILDVVGGEEVDRNLAAVGPRGTIVQVGLLGGGAATVNVGALDGEAGPLGRHDAAFPAGGGEDHRQPALRRRGAAAVQRWAASPGDRPPLRPRRRRRGAPPDGGRCQRRQAAARRLSTGYVIAPIRRAAGPAHLGTHDTS